MKRFLIISLVAISFTSCFIGFWDEAPDEQPLWIINNDETTVYYYFSLNPLDKTCFGGGIYPDTTLIQVEKKCLMTRKIEDNNKYHSYDWSIDYLVKNKLSKDTLSIFFFSVKTVENYSWEEIRQDYKILRRYDLSIQDLQKLGYKIPYPPTETMSNMRMFPLYGQ